MRPSSVHEAPFDATAASEAAPASAVSASRFELMPWVRGAFVFGFLFVSLLNVIYLLIAFVATRRLIRYGDTADGICSRQDKANRQRALHKGTSPFREFRRD